MLPLTLRAALIAVSLATVVAQDNMLENGNFENGSWEPTWTGVYYNFSDGGNEQKQIRSEEMLSLETADTPDKSGGALRVTLSPSAQPERQMSHNAGAQCVVSATIPANIPVKISFDAKLIEGPPFLMVDRTWSGNPTVFELSDQWQHFETTLTLPNETPSFLFSLVSQNAQNIQPIQDGIFLLDNVTISFAED